LSNSQCSVNGAGSSVVKSKYTLTLNVPVTFAATFAAGLKGVFAKANPNDWLQVGTWGTPQPPTVSLSPTAGSGVGQTFRLLVSDPAGVGDLSTIHLLFNTTSANQVSACSIFYNPKTNELFIYDDTGATLSAPIRPGTLSRVSNSQCNVNGTGSSVTKTTSSLTLNVSVTFAGTFTGLKNVYVSAAGSDGLKTGYVQLGTWTPFAGPS
jgi:hypothetical protein